MGGTGGLYFVIKKTLNSHTNKKIFFLQVIMVMIMVSKIEHIISLLQFTLLRECVGLSEELF